MADISRLARLVSGVWRQVDLSTNTLVVDAVKFGGGAGTDLTKTILDKLINLQNGTDFSTGTNSHTHDGRYYTETELGAQTDGASGASKIGIDVTPAFTNFTSGSSVQSALEGIDTALGTASVVEFLDSTFRLKDEGDNTKKIAFQASGITTATVRTITMPDANVDLGNLTNSNISATAAIAYSKLSLAGSIVNADVAAGAAIALNKLAALTISSLLVSDGSGVISVSAVTSTEAGYLSGVTSAIQTQLNAKALDSVVIKKDGSVAFTADQSMGGFKLTNVATPVASTDGANKAYVDGIAQGLDAKASVRAATTANITLSGAQTIDGVAVVATDRVLVKSQTAPAENGLYVAAAGAWSRATDMDVWIEVPSSFVFIEEGTTLADTGWVCTSNAGGTLGTTAIDWVQFSSAGVILGGAGLTKTGNTIDVVAADNSLTVNADSVQVKLNVVAAVGNLIVTATGLAVDTDGSTLETATNKLQVKALGITNAHISATAAIAYSKLSLAGSVVNADVSATAAIAYSKLNLSASIVNADVAAGAAIAYSKLSLSASIVNADIAVGAAIAYSKLSLSNSIVAGDLTTDSVTTIKILDANVTAAKLASGVFDQSTITGGTGSAAAVQNAPLLKKTIVSDESMAANTSFAVRLCVNGETAGRYRKADQDATSSDLFYVIGIALSTSAVSAGGNTAMVALGTHTLGSSDTNFGATDIGKAVFLTAAGAFSVTAPTTANYAAMKIGIVEAVDKIFICPQLMGIS